MASLTGLGFQPSIVPQLLVAMISLYVHHTMHNIHLYVICGGMLLCRPVSSFPVTLVSVTCPRMPGTSLKSMPV